ncbi:MAG: polyhydroxyalkanoate synthesis regulator DNA-binding domain-containing protein [Thermodesulfobacteriota bacterium]
MQENLSGHVVIKKYSNRRLYDTKHKKYVTLDEIGALIREGNEIKVIDTQTGEDISKLILIQVVLESEKNKEDILPVSFLHMLIKYGNKIARDFIENSFLMMFQPYLSFQDSLKKNMSLWKGAGLMPRGLEMPFPTEGQEVTSERKDDYEHGSSLEAEEPKPSSFELEELRQKIKELDTKIKNLDKTQKSKPKKRTVLSRS